MFTEDKRFSSQRNRSRRIREVYAWVAGVMRTRSSAQWQALLDEAEHIPYQVVNSIEDLLNDPHLNATGFIGEEIHPPRGTCARWAVLPRGPARRCQRYRPRRALASTASKCCSRPAIRVTK